MRAFAVIGPSQSGKSTLVEAVAGLEGARSRSEKLLGGVAITTFEYMGDAWAALDIPGGYDSLAQAGQALAACDAAVLCLPPEADAAVLAAPYLRLLEESGMPTFLFINKIDSATDRVADIVSGLQTYCAHGIVLRQVPMREDGEITGAIDLISERAWKYNEGERSSLVPLPDDMVLREEEARAGLLESLADFDDTLLEQIIEDQVPGSEDVYSVATRTLQTHELIPAFLGAASHGNGIQRLMKSLRHEAPGVQQTKARLGLGDNVLAAACGADHRKHLGKAVLLRALGPGVASGAMISGDTLGGLNTIGENNPSEELAPGAFALAIKSDHLSPGCYATADGTAGLPQWAAAHAPVMHRLVVPVHERDENKLSGALAKLAEIDPGLTVSQDSVSGHLEIGVQGAKHLKASTETLAEAYGIEVECAEVPTALRETIRRKVNKHYRHRKQSGGAGQFADIVIDVAPRPQGSGFAFDEVVKGGAVPRNYIPAVEAGALEAMASGPSGHPVVDVGVTLLDGKSHSVDSSDFAFRTAGSAGVREALAEAGSIVLQPILSVTVHAPSVFSGELVQLASGMKGQVLGFEPHPAASGWDVFRAQLPMAAREELARALGSATRGTAWFTAEFDHYQETREPAAVG